MIYLLVFVSFAILVTCGVVVWFIHGRRPREHGTVLRNPDQKVRTPAAVRRARAPRRKARIAHKRGRRRFR